MMAEVMLGRPVVRHSPARLGKKKAAKMLDDGEVRGHSITSKQERFFQAVAHGMKPRRR